MDLLLIEDNEDDALLVRSMICSGAGSDFKIDWADRLSAGAARLAAGYPDAVLLDLSLPDSRGLATFERVHAAAPQVPIVVLSGLDDSEVAACAVNRGAQDYLVKGRFDGHQLHRSLLYAVARAQADQKLRCERERLTTLLEIHTAITASLDSNVVLNRLKEKILECLPQGAGFIWLTNPKDGRFGQTVAWNIDERRWNWHTAATVPPLIKDLALKKEPLIVIDLKDDPRKIDFGQDQQFVSCLGLPLQAAGEFLGVLLLLTRELRHFSGDELHHLERLADQTASAIYNCRRFEARTEQAAELARSSKWRADFCATIAHDLRAPLMNMIQVAEMMSDQFVGPITEEQKHWLGKISSQGRSLADSLKEFLQFSEYDAGAVDLRPEVVRLDELVKHAVQRHGYAGRGKKLVFATTVAQDLPDLHADRLRLEQALSTLLAHLIKVSANGAQIEVVASAESSDRLRLELRSSHTETAAPDLAQLFKKYTQTKSAVTPEEQGVALDLAIAQIIVEAHGGSLWADTSGNAGVNVCLALPFRFLGRFAAESSSVS